MGRVPPKGQHRFQSTLPVRGATGRQVDGCGARVISIHAPRAGSDRARSRSRQRHNDFNPRSPCGERRRSLLRRMLQSYFNPRSPCGERRGGIQTRLTAIEISIHAPRAGSDARAWAEENGHSDFNPRSPCGERRGRPREARQNGHFNPRSPCGERLSALPPTSATERFQSTLPVRGATRRRRKGQADRKFQSTLPVRGATAIYCAFASSKRNIYSISYSKHCERYKRQTSFN